MLQIALMTFRALLKVAEALGHLDTHEGGFFDADSAAVADRTKPLLRGNLEVLWV
jgi:hypothetical protein